MGANDILNALTKLKFHIFRFFVGRQYSARYQQDQIWFATLMEKKFTSRFFFLRKLIAYYCLDGKK